MRVYRAGQAPGKYGSDTSFTGDVWMEDCTPDGAKVRCLAVHFQPASRTHWHRHPEGQFLYVVYGKAIVQSEGEPAVVLGPGDVVHSGPSERHWHGAAPGGVMIHVAIVPAFSNGAETEWGEALSSDEYEAACNAAAAE